MTAFTAILLTLSTFAVIVYPFFRQRKPSLDLVDNKELGELHSRRDTTYSMLKELEFDFQSGILTEEDYRDLEARYKTKAIAILSDIDAAATGAEVEDEIEKQVQKLRRAKSTKVAEEDEIERQVKKLRQTKTSKADEELEREIQKRRRVKGQFCTQCGTRYEEGDRFCSQCGASLRRGGQS